MNPLRNVLIIVTVLFAMIVSAAITVAYTRKQEAAGELRHEHAAPGHHGGGPDVERPQANHHPMAQGAPQTPQPQPQPQAAPRPAPEPTQAQLEASRLQLEASRAQLEASRKALDAADKAGGNYTTEITEEHRDGSRKQSPNPEQAPKPGPPQPAPSPPPSQPAPAAAPGPEPQSKAADGHAHKH